MLVTHPSGMFKLGEKGLSRDREAQPVAMSSTLTQARPNIKRLLLGGLATDCLHTSCSPEASRLILQRRKDNRWRLIEVKSTTDLKDHHLEDVAIQSRFVFSRIAKEHATSKCGTWKANRIEVSKEP